MTFTNTITEVQAELKVTANVPRVLFVDVTEKFAEPPPLMLFDVGLICKLLGFVVVIVPVLLTLTAMFPLLPPFFLIEMDEGLAETVQPPEPEPLIGGAGGPLLPPQSAVLLRTVAPATTVLEAMSAEALTLE